MIHNTNSNNGPAWSRDRGYHTPESLPDYITNNSRNKTEKDEPTPEQWKQFLIHHIPEETVKIEEEE